MSTTLKTKKFTLEPKPVGAEKRVNRSIGRVGDNSVPVLIRLPNLSSDNSAQATPDEIAGDSTTSSKRAPSATGSRSNIGQDRQKKSTTKNTQPKTSRSTPVSSWGWQVVVGVGLIGFLGLAYVLMTGGPKDDQPAIPPDVPDGLFIEKPNDKRDGTDNIVASDDRALGNSPPLDAIPDSGGAISSSDEPNSDFDLNPPQPTGDHHGFENQATGNCFDEFKRDFKRDEPSRDWNDGEFVEGPSTPIQDVVPNFQAEATREYPTTDPNTYTSPWELRPEWRTGERESGPGDSRGSNQVEDRQPGMATIGGVIEPPPIRARR